MHLVGLVLFYSRMYFVDNRIRVEFHIEKRFHKTREQEQRNKQINEKHLKKEITQKHNTKHTYQQKATVKETVATNKKD